MELELLFWGLLSQTPAPVQQWRRHKVDVAEIFKFQTTPVGFFLISLHYCSSPGLGALYEALLANGGFYYVEREMRDMDNACKGQSGQ